MEQSELPATLPTQPADWLTSSLMATGVTPAFYSSLSTSSILSPSPAKLMELTCSMPEDSTVLVDLAPVNMATLVLSPFSCIGVTLPLFYSGFIRKSHIGF